jgi:hypothetical protein
LTIETRDHAAVTRRAKFARGMAFRCNRAAGDARTQDADTNARSLMVIACPQPGGQFRAKML